MSAIDKDTKQPLGTGDPQSPQSSVAYYLSRLNPLQLHKRGKKTKAVFALAIVCVLWGTTWIASKRGVEYMPALQMAGIRQFLGGFCYFLFFLFKREKFPRGKEWGSVLVLSFLNFVLSNALSTWGIKYISAGLGSIIGAIFPLWLVIISIVGSKMKVHRTTAIGLLLGFSGICVIFYEHLSDFLNPGFRHFAFCCFHLVMGLRHFVHQKTCSRIQSLFQSGIANVTVRRSIDDRHPDRRHCHSFHFHPIGCMGSHWLPGAVWFCSGLRCLYLCAAKSSNRASKPLRLHQSHRCGVTGLDLV
jgi:hypothetical protein